VAHAAWQVRGAKPVAAREDAVFDAIGAGVRRPPRQPATIIRKMRANACAKCTALQGGVAVFAHTASSSGAKQGGGKYRQSQQVRRRPARTQCATPQVEACVCRSANEPEIFARVRE